MSTELARIERALSSAGSAWLDLQPDWQCDRRGLSGRMTWRGAEFGIAGLGEHGPPLLLAATVEVDRESLLAMFAPAGGTVRGGEFRVSTGDAHIVFLHCDLAVEPDADGWPRRICGTFQDVTDRHRFEDTLAATLREREMLLGVIDACPISITVFDAAGSGPRLLYANRMFQSLTGYDATEVLGCDLDFLHGADSDPAAVAAVHRAVRDGRHANVRLVSYRKDGSSFLNQLELAPICDASGRASAFLGLQKDITDEARRTESELQRQRVEALGRMVGGIAHELNNLLQPITLLAEEQRRQRGAGDIGIDTILDCTLKARQIIGDLLAFCRPVSRITEVVPVRRLLEDALVLVRKAVGPGTAMLLRVENAAEPSIRTNRTAFTQILLNLASNAAAAMGGRGTITVRLCAPQVAAADEPPQAEFRVEDSGTGMDALTLERAFEPFFTTRPIGQGSGLGLSVVFRLISEMGGRIALESTPGRGTTAIVRIPQWQGER